MGSSQKLTYAGKNIMQAPYNAYMMMETKYWWLDGFTFAQFPTSATSLINSKTYIKEWVITVFLRIVSPDMTRATMQSSYNALAALFNPLNGDQQLIFDEFPMSYFMAKPLKMTITKESSAAHIIELEADFACTGPARSVIETVVSETVSTTPQTIPVLSLGDLPANPRYRFTSTAAYTGNVVIRNSVTLESVTWNGTLAANDVLDFIMDVDYGTPYTVLHNGNLSIATIVGPAWPHIPPGDSSIVLNGPASGTLEVRWRDKWLVGQQSFGIPTTILLSANYGTPSLGQVVTFTVKLNSLDGPISEVVSLYHYNNGIRTTDATDSTDVNGTYSTNITMKEPSDSVYYAEFAGTDSCAPCISTAVTVVTRTDTQLTFTASETSVPLNTNMTFSGQLQWLNPANNTYEAVAVSNEPIQLYYTTGGQTVGPVTFFTNSEGNFAFRQAWDSEVDYTYYVVFPGDGVYNAATSQTIEITTHS
jgi:Phage tail protein